MTIWLICDGLTLAHLDVALSLDVARKRSIEYVPEQYREGVYFTINNRGNMSVYSQDGEKIFVQIVQCEGALHEVITRWSQDNVIKW